MFSYFLWFFKFLMAVGVIGIITLVIGPSISAFFGLGGEGEMYLMFFIFFAALIAAGWSYDRYKEKRFFEEDDD